MQQLQREGASVKPGSSFFGKPEVADAKKDRPDPFTVARDEFPDTVKKQGR